MPTFKFCVTGMFVVDAETEEEARALIGKHYGAQLRLGTGQLLADESFFDWKLPTISDLKIRKEES